MSVILDALKKLEQEKAVSRSASVDIVPEMVRNRHPRLRNGRWLIGILITGAVATTAIVTIFAMGGFTGSKKQPLQHASAPVASIPAPLQVPDAAEPVVEPALRSERYPEPAAMQRNPVPRVEPVAAPPTTRPYQRQQPKAATAERLDESPQVAGSSPASLKLSGIAWQDDRRYRRAVVNGVLAAEGEVIEGSRIVAIHQDKVRFSRDGLTFDVAISGPTQGR
jgi:general secretion pathway protein B